MSDVQSTCRDTKQLAPNAQIACGLFLDKCKQNGIDVFVTETYRSQERQNYLYSLGRTIAGNTVTWTKKSRHTSRLAWDIACRGDKLYDENILKKCGEIAKQLNITWGGAWKTPDTPHFEITQQWQKPEEDINMEQLEQLQQEVNSLKAELVALKNKMVYNYVDDNMPDWARATVQKLINKGVLRGNENGELGLTDDLIRILVINDRAGVYDHLWSEGSE